MDDKKNDFIHIRSDAELKAALDLAAKRADRKYTDQARYLLRLVLGLVDPEEDGMYRKRVEKASPRKLSKVPMSLKPGKEKGGRSRD